MIRKGIGLLGGSFDPVHQGHLAVARGAYETLSLAEVDLVVAPSPWQKSVLTSLEHRLAMVKEAIEPYPFMQLNTIEALRNGPTYTIQTLKDMREKMGPSVPLVLILGDDQWGNFHTWKDWEYFLQYAHLAICNRASTKSSAAPLVHLWSQNHFVSPSELCQSACGSITRFSIAPHPASSTRIRHLFASKTPYDALKELEQWLPSHVSTYIVRNHLYFGQQLPTTPASELRKE